MAVYHPPTYDIGNLITGLDVDTDLAAAAAATDHIGPDQLSPDSPFPSRMFAQGWTRSPIVVSGLTAYGEANVPLARPVFFRAPFDGNLEIIEVFDHAPIGVGVYQAALFNNGVLAAWLFSVGGAAGQYTTSPDLDIEEGDELLMFANNQVCATFHFRFRVVRGG